MSLKWTEAPQAAIIFDWRWQIVFRLTPKFRTDQCVFLWCLSLVSFILNSIVKIITWDIILASTIIVIGVQFWLTAIQSFSKYFSEEKKILLHLYLSTSTEDLYLSPPKDMGFKALFSLLMSTHTLTVHRKLSTNNG